MAQLSLAEFVDEINAVMPVIMRGFLKTQANELTKGKITMPQFLILDFLAKEGLAKMTALAHFMAVSTAAATGIVERLVRGGYVSRAYDQKDRRIIKIKLTLKGAALVEKITQQRQQMHIKIFGKICERDRQDYLRILMQIKEILSREAAQRK